MMRVIAPEDVYVKIYKTHTKIIVYFGIWEIMQRGNVKESSNPALTSVKDPTLKMHEGCSSPSTIDRIKISNLTYFLIYSPCDCFEIILNKNLRTMRITFNLVFAW